MFTTRHAIIIQLVMFATSSAVFPQATVADDARLDQKVTIKAVGKPLGDLLAELTEMTGVRMTARRDVADDKVVVLVKDMPLGDLHDVLKDVVHLRISREGIQAEWRYDFWMDLRTRQEIAEADHRETARLQQRIQELIGDLNLTPEELEERYAEDTYAVSALKDAFGRAVLKSLGSLRGFGDLFTQGSLVSTGTELTPAIQSKLLAGIDQTLSVPAASERVELVGIDKIEWRIGEHMPGPAKMLYFVVLPRSAGTTAPGQAVEEISAMFLSVPAEVPRRATPEKSEEETSDQLISYLPESDVGIYEVLAEIAELADINIVSDYFTCLTRHRFFAREFGESEQVGELLEYIAERMEYELTRNDDAYLLVSKKWQRLKPREIPERLVKVWRETAKKIGWTGMQAAIEMAELRPEQLRDLPLYDLHGPSQLYLELLRFLGSLTAQQRTQAMSEEGLCVPALDSRQRELLIAGLDGEIDSAPFYSSPLPMFMPIASTVSIEGRRVGTERETPREEQEYDERLPDPSELLLHGTFYIRTSIEQRDEVTTESWDFRIVGERQSRAFRITLPLDRPQHEVQSSDGTGITVTLSE